MEHADDLLPVLGKSVGREVSVRDRSARLAVGLLPVFLIVVWTGVAGAEAAGHRSSLSPRLSEARLLGREDPAREHRVVVSLAVVAAQGRVLVSHDVNTLEAHFRVFVQAQDSPGLILMPQWLPVSVGIEGLLLLWETLDATDLENRVCLLPSLSIY